MAYTSVESVVFSSKPSLWHRIKRVFSRKSGYSHGYFDSFSR